MRLDGNSGKGLASGRNNLAGKKRHTIRADRRAWRRERVGGEAKRRKCSCDVQAGFHRRDLSPSGVGIRAVTITAVPNDNDTPTAKGLQAAQARREITDNHFMRESPVMISSTMPSAKYSCPESSLMFWNGRTAIVGLSESVSDGS